MPKRTRLKRGSSKPRKTRLAKKYYSKTELDQKFNEMKEAGLIYGKMIVASIRKGEYPDGDISLTYGYVPAYRDFQEVEMMWQDEKVPPEQVQWLYEEFGEAMEDYVHEKTGWAFVGDPGDGTVIHVVSPKRLKELEKEGML